MYLFNIVITKRLIRYLPIGVGPDGGLRIGFGPFPKSEML